MFISIEQQKADSYLKVDVLDVGLNVVVCLYVYLFYCYNMVKVQGYDSPVVTYTRGIYIAFRTNEPASPRDLQLLTRH